MAKQKKSKKQPEPEIGTEQLSPELIAMLYGAVQKTHTVLSALLYDYAETVSKIEGKEPQEIGQRVIDRANQMEEDVKAAEQQED